MSNLALCASTGELPVDLVALREEVLAAGGAVGNDVLRRLLARGPSWAMAGVLDAIDSDLVFPVECDLPDPEAVTEHAMQVAVREGADAGRLILLQLWKRQEAWTASRSMTTSNAYATSAMDRTGRETSRFDVSRSGVVAEVGLVMGVHGSTADVKITQAGLLRPELRPWFFRGLCATSTRSRVKALPRVTPMPKTNSPEPLTGSHPNVPKRSVRGPWPSGV